VRLVVAQAEAERSLTVLQERAIKHDFPSPTLSQLPTGNLPPFLSLHLLRFLSQHSFSFAHVCVCVF